MMKLHIVSPDKIIDEQVDWVEVNTDVGNFVIQPGHIPMLLVLTPKKEFSYKPVNKNRKILKMSKGIVAVSRTLVTALIHLT